MGAVRWRALLARCGGRGGAHPERPLTGDPGSSWRVRRHLNPLSLAEAPRPPRHPFMAPNDRSNIHDDAYQTDTADGPGRWGGT